MDVAHAGIFDGTAVPPAEMRARLPRVICGVCCYNLIRLMELSNALLPDGRTVYCVNSYEVDFSAHEIFGEDLTAHGLRMPSDGVFVDVGANIGLFSLRIADVCPNAKIFAFEPMPAAFAALERNVSEFAPSAQAFRIGLGAAPGTAEFDYYPAITALSTCNSATGNELAGGIRKLLFNQQPGEAMERILDKTGVTDLREETDFAERLFRVEKVDATIDTFSNQVAALGIDWIDLLKIDTEGNEKEVLAGIREEDWGKIRQLLVEVHLGREEMEHIAEDLHRRGFEITIGDHPMAQGGASVFHIYAKRTTAAQ